MTTGERELRYSCRRCGMVFALVGPRLTDAALRMLREHIRQAHPGLGLPADAPAGEVLHYFDVAPEEGRRC